MLGPINAASSFLNRTLARATANLVRLTTSAQAILAPSVALLDDPTRWVLVIFLEKLPPPAQFVTAVRKDGAFRVEP